MKEGILTKQEIVEWKNQVNERVEELVGSDHLKFTVDIWDAGGVDDGVDLEGVPVCNDNSFHISIWNSIGVATISSSRFI